MLLVVLYMKTLIDRKALFYKLGKVFNLYCQQSTEEHYWQVLQRCDNRERPAAMHKKPFWSSVMDSRFELLDGSKH